MASVVRSFPPPTAVPLAFYSPGLTGIDSALPSYSTTFGWVLQRVFSLTTAARTIGFKWLSLDNLSPRPLDLPATPTTKYCLEPTTTTLITTGNFSLATCVVLAFNFLVSLLFGAGMLHFGRRAESLAVSRQKAAKPSPWSFKTNFSTLFHQDATVLPLASYMPRLSSLRITALSFVLRGLAFLSRLICLEKILDIVEDKAADHEAATGAISHIAELRVLNRRLIHSLNLVTPVQMGVSPLQDANKTVVAPFTPAHAKSKLERVFLLSSADKVDVTLLPAKENSSPPACIHIDPASSHEVSPPSTAVSPAQTPSRTILSATVGEADASKRRSSTPSSLVYKSPYEPPSLRRASGNHLSTPSRQTAAASRSVEPPCVPDRPVALEPRAESSALEEMRRIFQRCLEDSPQRQRYPKPTPGATPRVDSKARPASVFQAEVQRIFRPCFDENPLHHTQSKSTTPTSLRHLDPPLGIDMSHRKNSSIKQEERPKTPPQNCVTVVLEPIPKDFQLQLAQDQPTTDHTSVLQVDLCQIPTGDVSVCTMYPLELQPDEKHLQPLDNSRDIDLQTLERTLERYDEKRELTAKTLRRSQEVDDDDEVPSTPLSECRSLITSGEWDPVARLHSLLELVVPLSDDQTATRSIIDQTSWSFEGYVRSAGDSTGSVEPSWRLEDHIPVTTDDEARCDDEDSLTTDDVEAENEASVQSWHHCQAQSSPPTPSSRISLQPSRSYSEESKPSCSRSHSPIDKEDQPQIIHDIFYSPPIFASSTPKRQTAQLVKGDKMAGFGIGSPSSRRMQRHNPRDIFYTSTPRVNHAQFGGFSTSTPRRDVDNRRDTWADFF